MDAASIESQAMPVPASAAAPVIRNIVPTGPEPVVWRPIEFDPRPAGPVRVRLAALQLNPGGTFRPASGPCQDVLVFVREGTVLAAGTGVASPRAPMNLYARDAVRFGAEADGIIRNASENVARTLVAFVRRNGEPQMESAGPEEGETCLAPTAEDPRFVLNRVGHESTTQPLTALGGQLRVRILLDEDGQGARHGGLSVLDGDPALAVPQHRHPDAAELIYIDTGSGTMLLGDRRVPVRSGSALYVPPGVLHDFRGDGSQPLRAIQIYSPSGPEQRFR
ncbi:MAG: cupin domain-containing protein [Sandaracinaceae bacterium]